MHLFQILILAGLFIGAIGFIWGVILAFRTSVLWGLGFLFLPFGWVIFLLGHLQETKRAAIVILLGVGLVIGGILQSPQKIPAPAAQKTTDQPAKGFALDQQRDARAARQAQLNEYQARADRRCTELNEKRAVTNPDDKAAVAAFNGEVVQYNALLDQIKTLRAQLQNP